MLQVFFALFPVFAVIALGHGLRRIPFLSEEGWAAFDRVNYYVFFPALIIHAIATTDFQAALVFRMGTVLVGAVLIITAALLAVRPLLSMSPRSFSSLYQCSIRWNGLVALAAAFTLLGPEGVSLVAIGVAVAVPTVNILSVIVLTHAADSAKGLRQLLRLLITNPLIIGCVIGVTLNTTGIGLPGPTSDLMLILGRGALALGLISVGAGLDLTLTRSAGWTVASGTAIKLIAMPAIMLGLAHLVGLEGDAIAAIVLIAAVPTASSGYVLARQLGGDAPLMASFVTATSLGALVTMPLWLAFAG